ncbi:tetratricopeptide repeat protein [Tundrisphaera sp. TA3]|uniref:tetratricopeptide repeat protein n=1 Tax=Tundrisphaera sp. TA3 TaxID=3435775 RepID=UPI003EB8E00F
MLSLTLLGGLLFVLRPSPAPDDLWRQAKAELDGHRFDRTLATLDRLRRLREPKSEDLLLRAEAEIGLGRPDAALENLARVPDGEPMAPQARLLAGQLELRRHRLVAAEALLRRAAELGPRLVQPLRELIYIYGMQLRRPELNRTFRALSGLADLNADEVYLWTLTRGVTWEPEEVSEYLAECVRADPADRQSRLGLAEALRQQNRFAESEAALASLPDSDPDARTIRARTAIDRGEDERLETLLAEGPADHAGLALLRGRLALARNEGPAALAAFRAAHAADPSQREAILGLGQALLAVGDAKAAAPYLEELKKHDRLEQLMQRAARVSNRDDPALIRDLGAACLGVGRRAEARSWYKLAIRIDPSDVQAQKGYADASAPPPAPAEGR